jgi:hypothetical protein
MAIFEISVPFNDPHFRTEVTLDRVTYAMVWDWNYRSDNWFMGLYFPRAVGGDEPIMLGKVVVARQPLLQGVVNDLRPPGELYVRAHRDPRRYAFQREAKLFYFDEDEGIA